MDRLRFTNNSATSIEFDVGTYDGSGYALKTYSFEYNRRNTHRPKQARQGSWPGQTLTEVILLHTTFDILSTGWDDFGTKKDALNLIIFGNPATAPTAYTLGTLRIRPWGASEDMDAPCNVDGDISITVTGGSSFAEAQLTWLIEQGYFSGVTTPANKYAPK